MKPPGLGAVCGAALRPIVPTGAAARRARCVNYVAAEACMSLELGQRRDGRARLEVGRPVMEAAQPDGLHAGRVRAGDVVGGINDATASLATWGSRSRKPATKRRA
jgi:hypothetical protein